MAEMLKQYAILLAKIAENPEERIVRYSLITPSQVKLLPDPTRPIGLQWEGAVHTTFSERARLASERVAVMDTAESWNYGDLDRRSNQLANYLVTHGVQPGDVVAIYAHRSASLVWALLGVLKAGAAFLILDPVYPSRRLIDILEAASPKAWLQIEAAGELPEELAENVEAMVANCRLVLPGLASAVELGLLEGNTDKDPEIAVGPDDLAYVAFTSGTTGEPKGIVGTHRPLSHFLRWHCEQFGLNESERISLLSGLSHDPLLRDVFTPLWLGATLCIPDPDEVASPGWLADWMRQQEVTVTHLTPAVGSLLIEASGSDSAAQKGDGVLPSLRYAFFGGDMLMRQAVVDITALAPSVSCVNFYGATETPQAMGYHRVPVEEIEGFKENPQAFSENVPLGCGIADVQLLVLTAAGKMAAVGELGEIYVRTPYLSRGYLNDDALTRERFIINPFSEALEDRLYRTGDLGRWLADGNIVFLGRIDHQVKIRGFRIELGEVEATLCLHPSVSEAVVVAREDRPGDKRLVAYVVTAAAESVPSTGVLRAFLQEKLPDYMIPSAFVSMDALPLTANRKVDRRALPAPDGTRLELKEAFVMPRTPVEEIIAGIWSDLLDVIQVGIYDNFFDLGGHSLMATRLISRLREALQLELPLRSLFEAPTVIGLTELILRDPEKREKVERNAKLLLRVAQLSENDVENILAEKF
jgi:amino acid adenylation domain-containing protein